MHRSKNVKPGARGILTPTQRSETTIELSTTAISSYSSTSCFPVKITIIYNGTSISQNSREIKFFRLVEVFDLLRLY